MTGNHGPPRWCRKQRYQRSFTRPSFGRERHKPGLLCSNALSWHRSALSTRVLLRSIGGEANGGYQGQRHDLKLRVLEASQHECSGL
jgi:hypothetical protein